MSDIDRQCRDAFIKTGMWPNTVMFDLWCRAWTAGAREQRERDAAICRAESIQEIGDGDSAYNIAIEHCTAAILAQPEPKEAK
jgi:hypothetical protein